VAYQRTIEEVYWHHRIWPKENLIAKPFMDAVMSQAQLETKVANYLRESQKVENDWQRPITPEELQAEMDRMAENTKQPDILRELFAALGNNPFVIAECLARPVLTERCKLATVEWRKAGLDSPRIGAKNQMPTITAPSSSNYTLPTIASSSDSSDPSFTCADDTWTPTTTTNAPDARYFHTAVWTGSEMIIWGGQNSDSVFNTGARYNPSTDSWTTTSITNAPDARSAHTAVWTGNEMVVWGGSLLNTGGRYNPATDSWTATSTANAPTGRFFHTAIWTGSEMIVWGGAGSGTDLNTGGRYDPSTDSWTATTITDAPESRELHTAVWSGSEMVVWGGRDIDDGGPFEQWQQIQSRRGQLDRYQHHECTLRPILSYRGVG